MKPGYGKSKSKAKKKKAAAKGKAQGSAADQDVAMEPAAGTDTMTIADDGIDYTMPSAKARLRSKMELKNALKAKVRELKGGRGKNTKLPSGKGKGAKPAGDALLKLMADQAEMAM